MSANTKLADLVFAAKVDDENEQFLGEKWHKDAEQALAAHDAEQAQQSESEYVRRREQEAAFKDGWQAAQAVPADPGAYDRGWAAGIRSAIAAATDRECMACEQFADELRTMLAAAPAAPAPEASQAVPITPAQINELRDRVNTLACLSSRAERNALGSAIKAALSSLLDGAAAAPQAQAVPAGMVRCPRCWEIVTAPAAPAPAPEAKAVPAVLKLSDGAELVREGPHWSFRRDGNHIRYLNRFETEFIRAAMQAAPQAQAAGQELPPVDFICEDHDSPWLICKSCAADGKCARTALAQRQPLTEAEIESLILRIFHGKQLAFCLTFEDAQKLARAIEAAHGIGGATTGEQHG